MNPFRDPWKVGSVLAAGHSARAHAVHSALLITEQKSYTRLCRLQPCT